MALDEEADTPLPSTLRFVMTFGALITIGWFALFFLLRSRW